MDSEQRQTLAKMYDKLLRDRKAGNKDGVAAATRWMLESYPDNPFEIDTQQHALFHLMCLNHHRWKVSRLNDCPGKREMIRLAGELADMDLPNPWAEEEPEEEPTEEKAVALGIVPEEPETSEEKHGVFKRRKKAKQDDSQGID